MKIPQHLIRPACAHELKIGVYWYRAKGGDEYDLMINNFPESQYEEMRERIKEWSEEGRIYVRKDRPGWPMIK